jgi:DeoD family purine-nucleoside phosphorylase
MDGQSNLAPPPESPVPIHINPTAPLAERVLLPGDPGRALRLAQALLESPLMFNHHRGLWGYTGTARDGEALTIQSTGMGGPSAAIVIAELAELGARRLIRTGTCGSLNDSLGLGELLIATEALSYDGTSAALGADSPLRPDASLLRGLQAAANPGVQAGKVASSDLFYDGDVGQEAQWRRAGARAVEMETATLFALARRRGLETASVLAVSDTVLPSHARIEPEQLAAAEVRMGELALAALAAPAA